MALTLNPNHDLVIQDLNLELSRSNQLIIQDARQEAERRTVFHIINNTELLTQTSGWTLTLDSGTSDPTDAGDENSVSIPVYGKVLSRQQWLDTYPAASAQYLYSGSLPA